MKSGIVIRLAVAVVILGTITGFLLVNRAKTEAELQRHEAATLAAQKNAAAKYNAEIQKNVITILECEKQTSEAAAKATNAVVGVTGKPFQRQPPKGALSQMLAPPPPQKPAQKAEPKAPPPAPVASDDAPPGELSRELLDKLRQAEAERKGVPVKKPDAPGDDTAAVDAGAGQPKASAPPRKPAPPPEPEIAIQARKVVGIAEVLQEKAQAARASAAAAEALASQVAGAVESTAGVKAINALLTHHNLMVSHAADAQEAVFAMGEPLQAVMAARDKAEREKEQFRQAEELQRKEEEHRKQVQDELAAVAGYRRAAQDKIKLYKYDDAVETLKARETELKTDESRKALAVLTERYTRLQTLHEFLVARINLKKLQWGWGQGPTAKDILAATKDAVKITGQTLPWTDASLAQMLKLLKHYLGDAEVDRKLRADQMMSLAVFYYEHGNDDDAQKLVRELHDAYPTMRVDLKRLLPF